MRPVVQSCDQVGDGTGRIPARKKSFQVREEAGALLLRSHRIECVYHWSNSHFCSATHLYHRRLVARGYIRMRMKPAPNVFRDGQIGYGGIERTRRVGDKYLQSCSCNALSDLSGDR